MEATVAVHPGLNSDALFFGPQSEDHAGGLGAKVEQRRVLIIDDDIDTARSLSYLLAMMGHKVDYAINGIAGLHAAQKVTPEVVILDLKLPDIHGAEMARQIRRDAKLRDVRIIAITGSTQEQDKNRAMSAGCDCVLIKPVTADVLNRIILRGAST